jgi:7-cyano-7-deazaguanine synthase in queuosine biosynthesis
MANIVRIYEPTYSVEQKEVQIRLTSNIRGVAAASKVRVDFSNLGNFVNSSPREALDFLLIAACVYGIYRFIQRRPNSVDGWSREIQVTFPVAELQKWQGVLTYLQDALSFLTGDYWSVNFIQSDFILPDEALGDESYLGYSQVNLFSGGLDSLIGAIDFLSQNPNEKLLLASHYDSHISAKKEQNGLVAALQDAYSERFKQVPSVRVFLDNSNVTKEATFRSRSLLFMAIALLIAQKENLPICVPENGSVSLNFPLSPSRRSACSTRTTHPTLLSAVVSLWRKLGLENMLFNPYELSTKGEMVKNCANVNLLEKIVNISNSCGKRGHTVNWVYKEASHCGVCMPCTYRQASLISIDDNTTYGNSINKVGLYEHKQGQDLGACLELLSQEVDSQKIKEELIINGLRELHRIDQYVEVVEKTLKELKEWVRAVGSEEVLLKANIKND